MADFYPSQEFWENDLEMPALALLDEFQGLNKRENWLHSLSGRQLSVVFNHCFKDKQNGQLFKDHTLWKSNDISIQQKRIALINISDSLFHYYLVSCFSHSKLDSAVFEIARPVFDEAIIESFLLSNNRYDKKSILFTLFLIDHNLLKHILHFNRIEKRGLSPFILQNSPRQKSIPFKAFLSEEVLQKVLKQHDFSVNDKFESQLQDFFCHQDRIYLFIRRARDSDLILSSNQVIHGYKPDRIILDFALNANQVNLSTTEHGLKMANSIVTQYFERECCFIDMRNHNPAAQVSTFLTDCVQELIPNVTMYELKFISSNPESCLTLAADNIEELLGKVEPVVGNVLHDVSLVQHVKLIFQNKKVTLSFQADTQDPNYLAVSYSEHVLNKKEREDFKLLFKDTYGLTILSKTKSNRLQANSD